DTDGPSVLRGGRTHGARPRLSRVGSHPGATRLRATPIRAVGAADPPPPRQGRRCVMFPILEAGSSLDQASLPAFVVARDGLYLRKRSLLGLSQTKVGRIAHLPEGREFLDYALPKVPQDLMARAVGFFRAVYRLQRT